MPDNKSQIGGRDRRTVAGDEAYEVSYFARRHGITAQQARELIARHGTDRKTLDMEAAKLKSH
jgi:hypothetical protein